MKKNNISSCVKIAACICGKDGLLSELEVNKILELVSIEFPSFARDDFESYIDEFFESDLQIEDYLKEVDDPEFMKFVLEVSKVSASSDGLDLAENIALQKAYAFWGLPSND